MHFSRQVPCNETQVVDERLILVILCFFVTVCRTSCEENFKNPNLRFFLNIKFGLDDMLVSPISHTHTMTLVHLLETDGSQS